MLYPFELQQHSWDSRSRTYSAEATDLQSAAMPILLISQYFYSTNFNYISTKQHTRIELASTDWKSAILSIVLMLQKMSLLVGFFETITDVLLLLLSSVSLTMFRFINDYACLSAFT